MNNKIIYENKKNDMIYRGKYYHFYPVPKKERKTHLRVDVYSKCHFCGFGNSCLADYAPLCFGRVDKKIGFWMLETCKIN
jgi:hypothetical protein